MQGTAWDWISSGKNDTSVHDIKIGDFEISWNLGNTSTFAIDKTSVNEAGWNKEGVIVKIVMDCTGRDENAEKEKLYADIENLIQDRADVPVTAEIIQRCRSKQEVHNALIKELKDSEKAGSIYRAIKPLLADKQGRV